VPVRYGNLVSSYAVKTPKEQCHAVCEGLLQLAFGVEASDYAVAVVMPISLVLHSVNHRAIRADGVNDGVAACHGLTRSAFGTGAGAAGWGQFVWQKRVFLSHYVHFGFVQFRPWGPW